MRIPKKFDYCFVCCLPMQLQRQVQREIFTAVKAGRVTRQEGNEAYYSRIRDLSEIVKFEYF